MRQIVDTLVEASLLANANPQTYSTLTEKYTGSVNATLQRVKFETAEVPLTKVDISTYFDQAYAQYMKEFPKETSIEVLYPQQVTLPMRREVLGVMKVLMVNGVSRSEDFVTLTTQIFAQIFKQVVQGSETLVISKVWESTTPEKEYVQDAIIKWVLSKVSGTMEDIV